MVCPAESRHVQDEDIINVSSSSGISDVLRARKLADRSFEAYEKSPNSAWIAVTCYCTASGVSKPMPLQARGKRRDTDRTSTLLPGLHLAYLTYATWRRGSVRPVQSGAGFPNPLPNSKRNGREERKGGREPLRRVRG